MKKSVPTNIPSFYTLVDNNTRRVVGDYNTLDELIKDGDIYTKYRYGAYFKDMVTMTKKIIDIRVQTHMFFTWEDRRKGSPLYWSDRTYRNLYVVDSWGKIIQVFETKKQSYRRYWYRQRNWQNQHRDLREQIDSQIRKGLVIKNHNVDKIKSSYHNTLHKSTWLAWNEPYYCTVTSSWRRVKTTQARRMAVNVCKDEGEPEFRGARRKRSIPTTWDEVYKSVHDNYKSWKHNSKRRKQWKPKAST